MSPFVDAFNVVMISTVVDFFVVLCISTIVVVAVLISTTVSGFGLR